MTPRPQSSVLWIADQQPTFAVFSSLSDSGISVQSVPAADSRVLELRWKEIGCDVDSGTNRDVDCIVLEARPHDDRYMLLVRQLTAVAGPPILWIGESEDSCLLGVDLGAADFLLQPFTERELLLRLRGILRRGPRSFGTTSGGTGDNQPLKRCGSLLLDAVTREAWLRGKVLEVTGSQFTVLECLMQEPCKIISRDELAMALYGRRSSPFERTIDVHISNLRGKIEGSGDLRIRTARGVGYFLAPVRSSV